MMRTTDIHAVRMIGMTDIDAMMVNTIANGGRSMIDLDHGHGHGPEAGAVRGVHADIGGEGLRL
jgi:hypothetical protein